VKVCQLDEEAGANAGIAALAENILMTAIELPVLPSFRLDGRRALVTGAGRGIGLALASALAEAGAAVTLCARSLREVEAVAQAIRHKGHAATAMQLDVTDIDAAAAALSAADPFDVLINNAGANRPNRIDRVSSDDFDFVMGLNVRASYFMAQAVAKRLIHLGRPGSIINMSSQMGHVGGADRSVYCASKWAVEGFSKAMAIDLAPYGIRVNTIAPTFIETPMTAPFLADEVFRERVLAKIKLGRLGRAEDITGAAVYLASDASALVTGTSLMIDGGWTAD
jgi:NAD(P)-dependent dehydrogenase (short-subunit alcohol dehydrogenase family)